LEHIAHCNNVKLNPDPALKSGKEDLVSIKICKRGDYTQVGVLNGSQPVGGRLPE
jgi:hypothetical protein